MNRKQKYKYMRRFFRDKKIKDGFIKRGIYGAVFNIPKKIERSLKEAKNNNHKEYMIKMFLKLAINSKSDLVINLLKEKK